MLTQITQRVTAWAVLAGFGTTCLAATPADYSWTTFGSQSVAAVGWSSADIGSFLAFASHADDTITIGDFRFVDLLGDGNIELVASADYSGRSLFNDLVIVHRSGGLFGMQHIGTPSLESLNGVISDINNDGKKEILVPTGLTPYVNGTVPVATWTAIYSWNGSLFQENTSSFSTYYATTVLSPLQAALKTANGTGNAEKIALAQIELDKATRVSIGPGTTGMSTAQALVASTDPVLRIWAASVLGDIGTADALTTLATLTQDADSSVALYAKSAQQQASWAHCDRVQIAVRNGGPEHLVDLHSRDPIVIAIYLDARRSQAIDRKSVTFGESGFEPSLLFCERNDQSLECRFGGALSGLTVSDAVATLHGKRKDQTCFVGQAGVQVVDGPQGRWQDRH